MKKRESRTAAYWIISMELVHAKAQRDASKLKSPQEESFWKRLLEINFFQFKNNSNPTRESLFN